MSGRRLAAAAVALLALAAWSGTRWSSAAGPDLAYTTAPALAGESELGYRQEGTWRLPAHASQPIDTALSPSGGLYIAEGRHNQIQVFDSSGRLTGRWPGPPIAPSAESVFAPRALDVDVVTGRVHILWGRYGAARAAGGELAPGGLFLDIREPDGSAQRPLRALPPDVPDAVDVTIADESGDMYIFDGSRIHLLDMPAALIVDSFDVGDHAAQAGRIAVLDDGTVVLANGTDALATFRGGVFSGTLPLPGAGVAISAAGELVNVLLATADPAPGESVIVALDRAGRVVAERDAGELGVTGPPNTSWPWSLDADATRWVFTSASGDFFVTRRVGAGTATGSIDGGALLPDYAPADLTTELLAAADLALSPGPGDTVLALDPFEGRLVSFDAEGRPRQAGAVGTDSLDLTTSASGATFVSSRSGSLRKYEAGEALAPSFEVPCACDLGGRLAAAGDYVYVTRSRTRTVGVINAESGRSVRELWVDDAVGLWPADLAAWADRLYAADLVTARVHAVPSAGTPDWWAAGLLAGPRRIAIGSGPAATRVLAAVMADGFVELHEPDSGNLIARFKPTRDDGAPFPASDVALGSGGRVLLADSAARVIRVFVPEPVAQPTGVPMPSATPTPSDLACLVRGNKVAAPARIPVGGTARVTITLAAECPARARVVGADIILSVDRSASMEGANMAAAQAAARAFVELLDVRYHRVALASFASDSTVDVPLTDNVAATIDGLRALVPEGETNLSGALATADAHLGSFGRADALPVIVLLTDGRHNIGTGDPRRVALEAHARGIQIYTIALGADSDTGLLKAMAGREDHYFAAPAPVELFPIYGQILRIVMDSLAGNLVVDDHLDPAFGLVNGSVRPPGLEAPERVRWGRSILPSSGITLTYEVAAREPGTHLLSESAVAEYTDGDGVRRTFTFPMPLIEVFPAPPTPTATATPVAHQVLYLPLSLTRGGGASQR